MMHITAILPRPFFVSSNPLHVWNFASIAPGITIQAMTERNTYRYKTGLVMFMISLVDVVCTSKESVTANNVNVLKNRFAVSRGLYDQTMLIKHQIRKIVNNFSFLIMAIASKRLTKSETIESKNING